MTTVLCLTCGLVWVDSRPSETEINDFYSREYRVQYKGSAQPKPKHCYRETLRAIERVPLLQTIYRKGMRVLDVGSGAGFFPYVLRRMGIDVEGIEPDREYVRFSRERLGLNCIKLGFLHEVPKADSFDIITCHHVFEHLSNPRGAFHALRRILNNDGCVLMEIPNIEATYRSPGKKFHIGHVYWYNPETISALAQQSGFNVERLETAPGTMHIQLVLRNADKPSNLVTPFELKRNAARVQSILEGHTQVGHFMQKQPYVRMFKKLKQYGLELAITNFYRDSAAVVESACHHWKT